MAVVPGRTIPENDGHGLLLTPIREQQPTAHDTDLRVDAEGPDQGIQPTRLHLGVVVEKDDISAPCLMRPGVAGTDETQVLYIYDQAEIPEAG